jgi:pimeloyl-ACP methyl ester carboxylesterase
MAAAQPADRTGHGRTADINRDFSYDTLADDISTLLDDPKIKQADLLGYSMGGGVAPRN